MTAPSAPAPPLRFVLDVEPAPEPPGAVTSAGYPNVVPPAEPAALFPPAPPAPTVNEYEAATEVMTFTA